MYLYYLNCYVKKRLLILKNNYKIIWHFSLIVNNKRDFVMSLIPISCALVSLPVVPNYSPDS